MLRALLALLVLLRVASPAIDLQLLAEPHDSAIGIDQPRAELKSALIEERLEISAPGALEHPLVGAVVDSAPDRSARRRDRAIGRERILPRRHTPRMGDDEPPGG
jgi:hypothetical protein